MSKIRNFLLAACVVAFSALGQTAFKAVTVNTNTGIFGAGALGSGVKLTLNNGVVSNSTAVNLTLDGTTYYGGDGKNNVVSGVGYALGMRYQTNGTPTLYPTALSVATIADLASKVYTDTATTNSTIEVRGYATEGDGGGGTFYFAPFSATNRIDTFASGSASFVWKRVPPADGVMSPAMAGAFGISGVGANLLNPADAYMKSGATGTNATFSGTNHWGYDVAHTFQAVSFSTTPGKMRVTLKGTPSGVQSIGLVNRLRYPGVYQTGRYLVRLKATRISGTAVAFALGKDSSQRFVFTPSSSSETTYNGYFDSTDATTSLYLSLATNSTANGSVYEFDDVECYYVGDTAMSAVPSPSDAPDEKTQFQSLFDMGKGRACKIEFPPNRIYRIAGGGLTAYDGTILQLNGSQLHFSSLSNANGILFTGPATVRGGTISSDYLTSGRFDEGVLQFGEGVGGKTSAGNILIEDMVFADDSANQHAVVSIAGSRPVTIRRNVFQDMFLTRRPINVYWSGGATTVAGQEPSINILIAQNYFSYSGQNYPTEGGGGDIAINGVCTFRVAENYSEYSGRSFVTISTGDWWDTRYRYPLLNSGIAVGTVENNAVANAHIGYRYQGTYYLASTLFAPMQVQFRNNATVGGARSGNFAPGVFVEPSMGQASISGNRIVGHRYGIQVTNQFVIPAADAFSRDLTVADNVIANSVESGIEIIGLSDSRIINNTIRNSGTGGVTGQRSGIDLESYNTNIVIRGNFIGQVAETTTNQNVGITIASTSRNHLISVSENVILGAAASGTPISYGASATYAIRGLNYTGSALTAVTTSDKLSAFSATTSAELAGVISDETGSGSLVFGTSPAISGPTLSGTSLIGGTPTFTAIPRPNADNTIDLGTSAASWKDIYADGDVFAGAGGRLQFSGRSRIESSSDGVLSIRTAAAGNMTRVLFGTANSSGPALSFSGTTVQATDGVGGLTTFSANTIELGHASDTTIARSAAGVVTIEGNAIITSTTIRSGTGAPEGVVTAPVGTLFLRTDGGAGSTFYVKESGAGNTGWVAK